MALLLRCVKNPNLMVRTSKGRAIAKIIAAQGGGYEVVGKQHETYRISFFFFLTIHRVHPPIDALRLSHCA